ncbi:hypothetical protein M885DRAFT_9955 [Pelagophyceae sp. CCMP2097]|nr:hypothetical protein M885DRAFT_9955 [Pelagophyceae sp. CCMP2097]
MKERVGASLPPAIDGAIEGEVDVTVSECRGTPEGLVLVLRWWGEGDGRPGVPFKGDSSASKCLFPVRVGERELGRYLRDMRALRFDAMVEGRVVGSLKVPL